MRFNVDKRLGWLLSGILSVSLLGCSTPATDPTAVVIRETATPSQQFTIREQDRAIELTRDDRVRKLLRAFQRQHSKAVDVMQQVAGYLNYGHLSVDAHLIIYHEREGAIKTPVNMDVLVAYLENMYAHQDQERMPVYIAPTTTP